MENVNSLVPIWELGYGIKTMVSHVNFFSHLHNLLHKIEKLLESLYEVSITTDLIPAEVTVRKINYMPMSLKVVDAKSLNKILTNQI